MTPLPHHPWGQGSPQRVEMWRLSSARARALGAALLALAAGCAAGHPSGISLIGNAQAQGAANLVFGSGPPEMLTSMSMVPAQGLLLRRANEDAMVLTSDGQVAKFPHLLAEADLAAQSLAVGGTQQWALWDFDSFDLEGSDSNKWLPNDHGSCGASRDAFLGGHCRFAATTANRHYAELPAHSRVRVRARVHFFDQWKDESVMLMVDNKPVWSQSHSWCPGFLKWMCMKYGVDSCGRDTPDRLSVKAEATFQHSGSDLHLAFTSNLAHDTDPCYTSWGVDDVSVELL